MTFEYKPRLIDEEIDEYLEMIGAILIEGPKWCGKTTTAEQHAKSSIKLQDTNQSENYLRWAKVQPSILLEGEKPRLIDEWQLADGDGVSVLHKKMQNYYVKPLFYIKSVVR